MIVYTNAMKSKCKIITLLINHSLNISAKSRSNNDEESPGMAELQPFLNPNADTTFNGGY